MENNFKFTAITHKSETISEAELSFLKNHSKAQKLPSFKEFQFKNVYSEMSLKGCLKSAYLRESLWLRLKQALSELGKGYSFLLFDTFRTKETQLALFEKIYLEQKMLNPDLSHEKIMRLTRTYVAHPHEPSRFLVPPHNSGGAVDLTLCYNDTPLDMGTNFDEVSELSRTDAFEGEWKKDLKISKNNWLSIRNNRRLLFNALIQSGFVNYEEEWWHYDLGDCIWAQKKNMEWFYPSMENEVWKCQANI